ncbi:hypothetical protein TW83_19125, partial [Paracoccus sp. S4493]
LRRTETEAALPALREEEQIAAALVQRLAVETEALAEAGRRATQAITALSGRLAQLDRDIEREQALNRDADEVVRRLTWEAEQLRAGGEGHDARLDAATAQAEAAAETLHEVEARLAELADESARLAARHQSAERLAPNLRAMF